MDIRARKRRAAGVIPYLALALWLTLGLSSSVRANTVTYVYTDPQGTPLAEANASGTITATFDYAPYGSKAMGAAHDGPGYTGHVNDADTGLVYMQARYYDPGVGRFLSVDPEEPQAGDTFNFNRYDYASNNPVRFTDPDGRAIQALWGAPIGAAIDIAAQKIANPNAPIKWKSVGVSALVGAATGGIASVARVAAIRGTISVSQAVTRTAAANAVVSAAGSAADSSVNGETPSVAKMTTAAVIGGALSMGAGRMANADAISIQKIASAPVTSPQGIGTHIAATTQSAGSTAAAQSAVSGVAGQAANIGGAVIEKKIEKHIEAKN